ncbi:hypothetical protein [Asticcacaulis sp.]|uniref:hypothetical protein n=1 Tax=Asticcacaulis sp. TaxID=1872648 RepID=UPI002C9966A0|nr:hypothetical protein [Asticcacaulis sp.]HTM80158.1 hypothetical protein [Asticcacaulis sp.]
MTEDSKSEKPAITIEEAMRRTLDRYDGVFKALAELERRELAESGDVDSGSQISLPDDPQTKK